MVHLRVGVDGVPATDVFGDGLVVSTPTGSSAYNYAARGPVLDPGLEAMLINVICPHGMSFSPVVLRPTSRVEVEFHPRKPLEEANVFVDGHAGSEAEVRVALTNLIAGLKGKVAVACFASNVARMDSVIRAAEAAGRRVCLVGRSMHRMAAAAKSSFSTTASPPSTPSPAASRTSSPTPASSSATARWTATPWRKS